jgi:chromosomal replication initiation ATPase DnaA
MVTRRRIANEPRNVAIYLVRRYTGATLESIGREFNIKKYSSVGSVIERMRMQILKDKRLRKRIAELEKKLILSQEQI